MGNHGERSVAVAANAGVPRAGAAILGTEGNDTLTGTAASETIDALGGNDTLRSGGGDDSLNGGTGDDLVYSGSGNDAIDGGAGYDDLSYAEAGAAVSVDLRNGSASGGAGNDTIAGIERITGSRFGDSLIAGDANATFRGGDGNDTLTGGAGRDRFEGNAGDDSIDGGGNLDSVWYRDAPAGVVVHLGAGTARGGGGNDVLMNVEDVFGSNYDDTLTGSQTLNTLDGGDGNDALHSTNGDDVLFGGEGIDTAFYTFARASYTLRPHLLDTRFFFTVDKPNSMGTDYLRGVERLHFGNDVRLAFDLLPGGHAGETARLLGAVFGREAIANKEYAGAGLTLLDGGMSYEALGAAAVAFAGRTRPADIVALLWTNVMGTAPTGEQAAPYIAMLEDGSTSVGALAVMAAETDRNAANINLTGLMETGLEYAI